MRRGELRRKYKHLVWRILGKLAPLSKNIVLADVQGRKMYLDLRDRVVCETLYTRGVWEEHITRLLCKSLAKGMVVLDLGANVGYYTLLAAERVGSTGRVFAFEPDPSCYGLLEKNVTMNGYTNVTPVNKAVSDRTGTTRLFLEGKNKGGHRIYGPGSSGRAIPVEVTSLDEFFQHRESPIHVVKMDIQGAEMAAFRGMTNIIERNENLAMMVEFWPSGMQAFGDAPADFIEALRKDGFNIYAINSDGGSVERVDGACALHLHEGEIHLLCEKGESFLKVCESLR